MQNKRILLFTNLVEDLLHSRLSLALAPRSAGHEVILMSAPGEGSHRFREIGIPHMAVKMNRHGINPFKEMLVLLKVWWVYRRLKPDVVHHFKAKPIIYGTIAARLTGVKTIINTITGLGYVFSSSDTLARFLRPIVSGLYRLALSSKKVRVVFQNSDDAKLFIKKGIVREECVSIIKGSGVDCEVYHPNHHKNGDPVSQVKVLFAGRLLREKGVFDFVQMARLLKGGLPSARFLVAGDMDPGNNGSISIEEYKQWKEEGVVELLGYRNDMADLLRDVDIVVFPSSYGEGVPRILIEAAASAVPMVAYDVPGSREIVQNFVNGFLAQAGDRESLTQAVKMLIDCPDLRVQLGKAGREKALKEFNAPEVADRLFELYEKAVYASV